MVLWIAQVIFAAAALIACACAATAALRRSPRVGLYLILAGAFGVFFFLSTPPIDIVMVAVALLTALAGLIMLPLETDVSVRKIMRDLGESTTRRLRRR